MALEKSNISLTNLDAALVLLHQEALDGYGIDEDGTVNYTTFRELNYQETLNLDYNTYDRYAVYLPYGDQYRYYNEINKIRNMG